MTPPLPALSCTDGSQVDEIKTNLPLELDFRHEADNADRCRANLASSRSTVARR
jgi:predicted unusual protein kinase regulating ubiquinone biosynthesis (AarF/ABC1/UbiB family)